MSVYMCVDVYVCLHNYIHILKQSFFCFKHMQVPSKERSYAEMTRAANLSITPHFDNLFWGAFRDFSHEVFKYYRSGTDRVCHNCAVFSTAMIRQVGLWQEQEGQRVGAVPPYRLYIHHQMRTPEMVNVPLWKDFKCENCNQEIIKEIGNSEYCIYCRVRYAENWEHFQRRPYDVMDILIE